MSFYLTCICSSYFKLLEALDAQAVNIATPDPGVIALLHLVEIPKVDAATTINLVPPDLFVIPQMLTQILQMGSTTTNLTGAALPQPLLLLL